MGFPISPAPSSGDTYSVENRVWTYDGFGWRFLGASGSIDVTLIGNVNYTVGNTFPISPTTGDKWFHLNDAVEYTYIQDIEDTSHWIEIGYGCPTIGGQAYGLTGINFPNTECVGDLYEYDSRIWVYNGYAWKMVCQNTGDTDFTFGLTAPINPDPGHRWVDSATGLLYTFIDDEDPIGQTGQWVNFSGSNFVLGPTGPTGEPGPPGPSNPNTTGVEIQVRNSTGSTLVKGTPVSIIDDVTGEEYVDVVVTLVDNYQLVPSLGLLKQDLTPGSTGYAIAYGLLSDIDTSSWSPGTNLWIASTTSTGVVYGLTSTETLDALEYKQRIAVVLKSDAASGILYILGGDAYGKNYPNIIYSNIIESLTDGPGQKRILIQSPFTSNYIDDVLDVHVRVPSQILYLNGITVFPDLSNGSVEIWHEGIYPTSINETYTWNNKVPMWIDDEVNPGWTGISISGHNQTSRGLTLFEYNGISYFELSYASAGPTGLTFTTVSSASESDKILLQRKPSNKMELITVGSLFGSQIPSTPTDIPGDLSGFKFAFYDSSGVAYSSSEVNVKSQILGDNITSLNGCTGAVGITGTTGEIEVTNSCPNIIIGLPDDVTISGNLIVGGFYYGFIDGGTFE